MEEEIDLGKYAEVLIQRWYLVLIPAVLCALIVGGYIAMQPIRYQARVLVAATRQTMEVSFDTAIQTIPDDANQNKADRDQALTSFAALVKNPAIAEAVLPQLNGRLPNGNGSVQALIGMVSGRVLPNSDLIEVTVTHQDRNLAWQIAQIWADEYVKQVNALYGDLASGTYASIQGEVATGRANYERDQAALEQVMKEDRRLETRRRISELTAIITAISDAQRGTVENLLEELQRSERLLRIAENMRDQVLGAGDSAATSSALALAMLKVQVYDASPTRITLEGFASAQVASTEGAVSMSAPILQANPYSLQIQADAPIATRADMLRDLESLISMLKARHDTLDGQITDLSQGIQAGEPGVLSAGSDQGSTSQQVAATRVELEAQIRELETELEHYDSLLKKTTEQRTASWDAYSNLIRKETELALAVAAPNKELTLGSPATVSSLPHSLARNTLIAGISGGLLGLILAFATNFWQEYRARSAGSSPTRETKRGD